MRRLKTIYYLTVLFLFTVAMFFIFAVVWAVTAPFEWKKRRAQHHISRFWSKTIYRLSPWWKVRVSGKEHIKRGESYIVVSNHQAMLDIPLLYILPFNFKWVSKKEVYKIPIFGWVLWMHGDVAIERGGAASTRKMMEKCTDYLSRGVSIVMFPEGTRTKTGKINAFKEGAMILAKESGRPILPVVTDGNFDAFKDGNISTPHTFQVKILPPIAPEEIAAKSVKETRDELSALMRETHREMAPGRYQEEIKEKA